MLPEVSASTQAILLLTAPLTAGGRNGSASPLGPAEYRDFAGCLHARAAEPSDLLGPDADSIIAECHGHLDSGRIQALIARGFLLSQALERWDSRSIWVVSRADPGYPDRIRSRLGKNASPILYGSGDPALLATGGLAVVGSRDVTDALTEFTENVGVLAARAGLTTVSGGARGIDQAAMRGAADSGGKVIGVLADRLERAVLAREHRNLIREGRLALISPYDPAAGFNVGHAMQRNELIYALADAALVVSADFQKGGTWAGALEQLEKLRYVPVFVRSSGQRQRGLMELESLGASPWPDPSTPEEIAGMISGAIRPRPTPRPAQASLFVSEPVLGGYRSATAEDLSRASGNAASTPSAKKVPDHIRDWFSHLAEPLSRAEIAVRLGVSPIQASKWLAPLIEEGLIERQNSPARYRLAQPNDPSLFD